MMEQKFHALLRNRLQLTAKPELTQPMTFANNRNQFLSKISTTLPLNREFVEEWASLSDKINTAKDEAVIAMVGKYNSQGDAYLSIISALKHSCLWTNQKLNLIMVDALHLEAQQLVRDSTLYHEAWEVLKNADGILVPGGFGSRGIEGKVLAAEFARKQQVPYLGICLGMQIAVIEFTRNVLGRSNANSEEFMPTLPDSEKAVIFMPEGDRFQMGGTMRLGSRKTLLKPGSKAFTLYNNKSEVWERHRHRYEVNPNLVEQLEHNGLIFSGKDESNMRMEIVELPQSVHPYFVASQFHPEFKSRPNRPSPLFKGFLDAVKLGKAGKTSLDS